jgi:hypothetical protein
MVFEKSFENLCRHCSKLALLDEIHRIHHVSGCCTCRNSNPVQIHGTLKCLQKRTCRCRDAVFLKKVHLWPSWWWQHRHGHLWRGWVHSGHQNCFVFILYIYSHIHLKFIILFLFLLQFICREKKWRIISVWCRKINTFYRKHVLRLKLKVQFKIKDVIQSSFLLK